MAVNKLALIRYKTIDSCLRNRFRKWTLEDLIEKVADVLYESEGIASGVSRRTIQADIQLMRSDKLGYNAPIIIKDRKYYVYEDPEYSITQTPLSDTDVARMREMLGVIKHINGFSYFDEMSEIVTRLENTLNITANQSRNCIQIESNGLLKGIQHINPLYQAVFNKRALFIEYRSFKAQDSRMAIYYPYLLKEYRNRWFLIARPKKSKVLMTLALDRIIEFQELTQEPFVEHEGVDFERYFADLLGVTKSEKDRANKVILHIAARHAPYILTKPLHSSQTLLKENEDGSIQIRLDVVLNFELQREILGFGECVKVLAPKLLVRQIGNRIKKAAALYAPPANIKEEDIAI